MFPSRCPCGSAGSGVVAAENAAIPNFASADFGWLLQGGIDFRPIPGKEEEYAEAYGELADIADNVNVEPPEGQQSSGDAE